MYGVAAVPPVTVAKPEATVTPAPTQPAGGVMMIPYALVAP